MKYRLNGKKISRNEFLKVTAGFTAWIEKTVAEAIEDGEPIPMFRTSLGPLVVSK